MTMTNMEMLNRLSILQSVSAKVTGRLAYAVARNIRKITNECQDFLQIKDDLIRKYGTEREDGSLVIQQNSEAYAKFMNELKMYTDIPCDVDVYQVNEEDFWNSTLNADEMLLMEFMLHAENNSDNGGK